MKLLSGKAILIGLLLALVAACGSNGSGDTSYNTKTNPRNFPQLAIDLLDNIESGKLADYDAIVGAFGELYIDHSDLLDNTAWQSVVNQLGHHFRQRADSLAGEGVGHYSTAAGMYI
ncbi:MAG: hypothetical protein KAT79_06325, partial [candidate division Zixibacteria bacterium]|nr:hypothetical protein [candidate division Zixibacteria bacterium]